MKTLLLLLCSLLLVGCGSSSSPKEETWEQQLQTVGHRSGNLERLIITDLKGNLPRIMEYISDSYQDDLGNSKSTLRKAFERIADGYKIEPQHYQPFVYQRLGNNQVLEIGFGGLRLINTHTWVHTLCGDENQVLWVKEGRTWRIQSSNDGLLCLSKL